MSKRWECREGELYVQCWRTPGGDEYWVGFGCWVSVWGSPVFTLKPAGGSGLDDGRQRRHPVDPPSPELRALLEGFRDHRCVMAVVDKLTEEYPHLEPHFAGLVGVAS